MLLYYISLFYVVYILNFKEFNSMKLIFPEFKHVNIKIDEICIKRRIIQNITFIIIRENKFEILNIYLK